MNNEFRFLIYKSAEEYVTVNAVIGDETLWLTQKSMAELFKTTKQNISYHINNCFKEGELNEQSVVKDFLTTAADGKPYNTHFYNLDVIISVGYRVKSQNGVIFRKWATSILKDYMLRGYAVNQKRLEYLEKTIKLIDIATRIDERLEANYCHMYKS